MTINTQDKVFEKLINTEAIFTSDNRFYIKFDSIEIKLIGTDTEIYFYNKGDKVYSASTIELTKHRTLKLEGLIGALECKAG